MKVVCQWYIAATLTDFADGDDFQALFVSPCPTAGAEVALVEDPPGKKQTHSITQTGNVPDVNSCFQKPAYMSRHTF